MKRLSLAATLALAAGAGIADDRALVIGIDAYAQPLNGAAQDATRFAAAISETWDIPSTQITTLTNASATSHTIMNTLIDELVGLTSSGDRAILYFAGKGTRLDTGEAALVAHDADALLGKIPSSVVADILDLIADRDVTVIIDASFDGRADLIGAQLTRGVAGGLADTAVPFASGAAERNIWTAAAFGQFAWEDIDRGVFTTALVDAMTRKSGDADSDGAITNAELLTHLQSATQNWCDTSSACLAEGRGFTPTFTGATQGIAYNTPAPVTTPTPVMDPILPASNAPASYIETLGFVTDLFAPSNDAGLTLTMSTGTNPRVNDIVSFDITASRTGQLVLLDIDPNGALAQVFPSALAPDASTKISAANPLTIPNGQSTNGQPIRIRVSEPAGQGFLLGLLIEGELPTLTAMLPQNIKGGPVPNAGQYLYGLSQELLALQADSADPIRWSATYLPYHIHH